MTSTRTRRRRALLGAAVALAVVAAGCGGDSSGDSGGDGDYTFIYLPPTPIGGNPFLELGWKGTQDAAKKLGGEAKMFESTDLNSRRANLEAAIEEKPTVVVMNTFDFTDLAAEFSAANPEQQFILIDSCPEAPPANLHCGVFREYEGAYLLGIMAGSLSEAKKIGSVGALDIPFLHRYTDSFALGAQSVDPSITDSQVWIGGDSPFTDPARAKEQALSLAAQGLDHIFAVGAGSNGGVFEAATEQGFFSYGVDINECPKAPGQIVDNNLKLVDAVVLQLIEKVVGGTAESVVSFGLADGGMGVIALQDDVADSGCVIADYPDVIEAVKAAADKIISGELVIPDPLMAG
ncbi:MAG: BMP family ABC transporter substrate-binding protein [Ilumatobacteraceae bacterium]